MGVLQELVPAPSIRFCCQGGAAGVAVGQRLMAVRRSLSSCQGAVVEAVQGAAAPRS